MYNRLRPYSALVSRPRITLNMFRLFQAGVPRAACPPVPPLRLRSKEKAALAGELPVAPARLEARNLCREFTGQHTSVASKNHLKYFSPLPSRGATGGLSARASTSVSIQGKGGTGKRGVTDPKLPVAPARLEAGNLCREFTGQHTSRSCGRLP